MYRLSEVYRVHWDLDFADDVMFTESVKVKHLQHQSLATQLTVGNLEREKVLNIQTNLTPGLKSFSVQTLKVKVSLKTGLRFLRWTLVSNFFFLSGSM